MNREQTINLMNPYLDPEHPRLKNIFPTEYEGKQWNTATDAYQFIMVACTEENTIEKPDQSFPNVADVIPPFSCHIPVNIDNLTNAYKSIPMVDQEITYKCASCDGEGKFDHYGYDYDCQQCDESGVIGTGRFEKVADPEVKLIINNIALTNRFIREMLIVIEKAKIQKLVLLHSDKTIPNMFRLDNDILIGIMPRKFDQEDEKEGKFIKVYL